MVGQWKGGSKEDCKLLTQEKKETAKLKARRPGEPSSLPRE